MLRFYDIHFCTEYNRQKGPPIPVANIIFASGIHDLASFDEDAVYYNDDWKSVHEKAFENQVRFAQKINAEEPFNKACEQYF